MTDLNNFNQIIMTDKAYKLVFLILGAVYLALSYLIIKLT